MDRQVVLSVKDLTKIYQAKVPFRAVDGVSFELKEGEILGLLGSNGAGKTTTIQMLLSTLKPTSGSIFYFGKNFFTHRSEVLHHIAFASTYISLPWMLKMEQNLEVFGRLYGLSKKQRDERIWPLMGIFSWGDFGMSLVLNFLYLTGTMSLFYFLFEKSRSKGLARLE